ncbi:cytokinin dehydrogenase 2 [Lolium perenne]|uniref:cytokinin dehydrogenase 2 n=1 Tax=Lolium perenne TaxID=4522 RepID=UPI0021EAFAFE|nr:cytokinin dehydrogenase 2-like [Lolium perenne]
MVAIHTAREMIIAALFVLNCVLSTIRADPSAYGDHALAWRPALSHPDELRDLGVRALIRDDAEATARASADFGNMSVDVDVPAAVLYPSCPDDIAALLRASSARPSPFPVSARGCGHSIRGQASAPGGVVVDMPSLGRLAGSSAARLSVSVDGRYIDAGGEQLWVDVLHASLAHGLTPRSWTDYLHLTVGGTLSNAGISGQAFRHGPQISNVQELDVITGLGERVTCSKEKDRDLFDAVLGGLGQFGVITRARIPLVPAPARARWVRLLYTDAAALTKDQERLIDIDVEIGTGAVSGLMDYVEGSVLADQGLAGSWRSSFFSEADAARVAALAKEAGGVLYCLEGALYYGGAAGSERNVDKKLDVLLRELRYERGFGFVQDVSYVGFLDRVRDGELKLRATGLWEVPHPWLNLFLPRSHVLDFAAGVFHGILRRGTTGASGPVLIYPMNRNRWGGEASVVFPEEEEVFYTVGILRSSVPASSDGGQLLRRLEEQNEEIMRFCEDAGMACVQYLPYYAAQSGWEKKHFGPNRWARFVERKRKYDPKAILSRGQRIFTSPLA